MRSIVGQLEDQKLCSLTVPVLTQKSQSNIISRLTWIWKSPRGCYSPGLFGVKIMSSIFSCHLLIASLSFQSTGFTMYWHSLPLHLLPLDCFARTSASLHFKQAGFHGIWSGMFCLTASMWVSAFPLVWGGNPSHKTTETYLVLDDSIAFLLHPEVFFTKAWWNRLTLFVLLSPNKYLLVSRGIFLSTKDDYRH